jgi:hypothetical protein
MTACGAPRRLKTQGVEGGARLHLRVSPESAADVRTGRSGIRVARHEGHGAAVGTELSGLRNKEGDDQGDHSALGSLVLGFVGDRWAIDVAGPLPVTARGNRYVIATVEYATPWRLQYVAKVHYGASGSGAWTNA